MLIVSLLQLKSTILAIVFAAVQVLALVWLVQIILVSSIFNALPILCCVCIKSKVTFNNVMLEIYKILVERQLRNVLETLAMMLCILSHFPPPPTHTRSMCYVQVHIQLHTWRYYRSVIHDQVIF